MLFRSTIDAWLKECVEILNAALTAYHSYSTSHTYRTMFRLWLSMSWEGNEIADFFEAYWELIGSTRRTPFLLYFVKVFYRSNTDSLNGEK